MPRAQSSVWAGAVNFGGFPIPLRAYNLIENRSAKSFKSLCPCHQQPIAMPKRCPVDDTILDSSQLLKGHEVSRGNIVVIPAQAADSIRESDRTQVLEIQGLPPLASVRFTMQLAQAHYRLVPDDKMPGSDQPVQILWNGLAASERALITTWVPRAGSRDSLLAIEADEFGLTGHQLPFASEVKDTPEFLPVENAQAAAMFEAFASRSGVDLGEFHHSQHESEYDKRRQAAIDAALAGQPIPTGQPPAPVAATPDLMAFMQSAVADAAAAVQAKPKKVRKTTAKPKAKAGA